jgi:uncharacterized glyoxalase superfamily protein PhnB
MATGKTINWPPAITPHICVKDARAATEWYRKVLDATSRGEPYVMPDGSIGHAELAVGDSVLMLAEGSDEVPVQPPESPSVFSHSVHIQVDDADATIDRARNAGAAIEREPEDQPYGRVAVFVDPFGHRWMVNQPPASASRVRDGDVGYITISTPDPARAQEFYRTVLGWRFSRPGEPDVLPMTGLGTGEPSVSLCFRVADIRAALTVVRTQGGTAGDVQDKPYGLAAECVDNQVLRFYLWQTPSE